tara:strand:+ start:4508 stop:5881 length:1374 start_codon:yes stop_codon:yes gene_type:complete
MKTFLTHLQEYGGHRGGDALSPHFNYGGSSTGPGMGQYVPMVDLNAQSEKEIKKSDLDQIERYADRLFASLGIDVEFTRHFLDRVNDERNKKQITPSELIRLFKQSYKKHGKTIAKLGPDAQAVINDMKTDINMPFVLNVKGGELELVAKTVMRKKDFKTSNKKLSFEDANPRIPRKKGQPAGSKKHSDLYTDENPRGTIHGLGFKDVKTAKASVNKIENSGKTHAHKIQAAIAMEQRARVMGKTAEAAVYRKYIEKMKKKTKQMQKEEFEFFPEKLYERITLPNPPVDLDKELVILKEIMSRRTEEDEQSIRDHDENSFFAIEKYCEKHGLIFHENEMKDIVVGAKETIGYFKKKFNLIRPFHLDKSIKPMGSKTNKTKSYPSGHATQSRLVGLYVSSKFPEHERGVMEAARECGIGRVFAGFHYLADYVCGNLLADKMFLVLNRDDYGNPKRGET